MHAGVARIGQFSVYDLPDSDGMSMSCACTMQRVVIQIHYAGVTNMWRLQYSSSSKFDKCTNYLLRSQ